MLKERLKWMAAWMAMAVMVLGAIRYVPEVVSVSTSVDGRELPICCVDTVKEQVALSFDTVRGDGDTGKILEILKKHDVKATFFVTGDWVAAYPEETKAIQTAGHDLGSLGESGQDMTQLDKDGKTVELTDVHTKVKELTGVEMELFRPPLGAYDNEVLRTANAVGYYIVQWSVDSMDWKDYGADVIAETVCSHKDLGNGAIIRCHNGAKYTAQALDGMLDGLKSQGYEIVPVSHLIYRSDFHIDQTGRQVLDR